jgi:hypothetical protein
MKPLPLRDALIALAAFVLLNALYVGSYYATVEINQRARCIGEKSKSLQPLQPMYAVGGEVAFSFYSPWHQIDRKIRPDYWTEKRAIIPLP